MPDRANKPYSRPDSRPVGSNGNWLHDKAPGATIAKSSPSGPTNKLLVSNLHYEITPKDLTAIFGQIGTLIREPQIRYDRSGRSSGVAIVSFETVQDAIKAKKQYDGILAKGEPLSIAYDHGPRRVGKEQSLLKRIEKPPLLDRLSQDGQRTRAAREPRGGIGPVRTRGRGRGTPPVRKQPQTAEDLDKELDAFMGDNTDPVAPSNSAPVPAAAGDVDMV